MISVTYGINSVENLPGFDGRDLGAVRAAFEQSWDIPKDAAATVNNQRAGESTRLTDGDEVAFVKVTAQKG